MEPELRTASLSEIQGSIDLEGICASSCPYLGSVNDRITSMAFADQANRCYRNQNRAITDLPYQTSFCLSELHTSCAIYTQVDPTPTHSNHLDRKSASLGLRVAAVVIVGLVLLAALISSSYLRPNEEKDITFIQAVGPSIGEQYGTVLTLPDLQPVQWFSKQLTELQLVSIVNALGSVRDQESMPNSDTAAEYESARSFRIINYEDNPSPKVVELNGR